MATKKKSQAIVVKAVVTHANNKKVTYQFCNNCGAKLVYKKHKETGYCKPCFEYENEPKSYAARMGRPTLYRVFFPKKVYEFLDECVRYRTIPFIQDVSNMFFVNDDTIYEWAKTYSDFSDAVKRLKEIQLFLQQKLGLGGELQPATNIFLMKANHGLKETSVVENHTIVVEVDKPPYDPTEVSES